MKARGLLIAGNWKLNHSPRETRAFFAELKSSLQATPSFASLPSDVEQIFFPPTLSVEAAIQTAPCAVGAQNISTELSGAFTGETSAQHLVDAGASWCLVGHSERRSLYGETDAQVARKLETASKTGLRTLLCVGETRAEREANQTRARVEAQLEAAIFSPDFVHAIAYEPVWAIGTGLTATPEQAQEVHMWIREWLWAKWGVNVGNRLPLLYGGSANASNAAELLALSQVDGLLVGGASLKVSSWLQILEQVVTTAKAR